ncbi:hypothetical protein VTN49DRAFT_3805 [Thermomyces lanuginosus]|uniref:uncharacterized protein n=1 Tax=Thermomyces lanuginosus TaxID=5541 RepID=UPI0037441A58
MRPDKNGWLSDHPGTAAEMAEVLKFHPLAYKRRVVRLFVPVVGALAENRLRLASSASTALHLSPHACTHWPFEIGGICVALNFTARLLRLKSSFMHGDLPVKSPLVDEKRGVRSPQI